MTKRVKIWLRGRSYLYLLNAETDAARAHALVESGNLAEAYCQYYWNGWYDYICGRLYGKFVKDISASSKVYEEINVNFFSLIFNLIWPLGYLSVGRMPHRQAFKEKFGVSLNSLDRSHLIKTCILTQEKNIQRNKEKIKEYNQEGQFYDVVRNTLKVANFWDKLFAGFLKFRFARILA